MKGLGVKLEIAMMVAGLALLAAACGDSSPWYDTTPDTDLSYLPLGPNQVVDTIVDYQVDGAAIQADGYLPAGVRAPVAIVLPGAFVTKERYRWIGVTLASHGVATFVVQPRSSFANSSYTVDLLAVLADDDRVDTSRVVLIGHSAGAIPQVGLTDIASCPAGFCKPEHRTPRSLRGLVLLSYHNQNTLDDDTPMPAVESPWLIVNGSRDGLATAEKVDVTMERIQDRPLYRVDVVGANHYQMTDYVDPEADLRLADDLEPTIGNREARATAATYISAFVRRYLMEDASVGDDLGTSGDDRVDATIRLPRVSGPQDHSLPRVLSEPLSMVGLADDPANTSITASAWYGGALYLLIRNDTTGAQVWRISADMTAEQLVFPGGHIGGFYGNSALNGLLGAMAVYKGELYVGASSGFQGARHDSTAAELWAYDGAAWRPVVSHLADVDPEVSVVGCSEDPGATTATLQLAAGDFTPDELIGAVVDDIGSPSAGPVRNILYVVANTASTITVQRDEVAFEDEVTGCDRLTVDHVVYVRTGSDENGFGQPWNKAITAMAVLGERLYVGSGFNYPDGAELYVTDDGVSFDVAVSREFFGRHQGGLPISSSVSGMHVTDLPGDTTLLVGTTGTDGYGARLLALTKDDMYFVVDNSIDDDDVGLDEAGMGHGNHQVMSMVEYRGRLWIAVMSFTGLELFSAADPTDVGSWRVEVGDGGRFPAGWGDSSQLAARLSVHGDDLWVSSVAFIQHSSELAEKSGLAWRTDGEDWQLVSAHAFGINAVSVADVYAFGDTLVGVAGNGSLASAGSYGGLRFYTLD